MSQLRVRGVVEADREPSAADPGRFRDVVSVQGGERVRVGEARGADVRELDVAPDQVVELELEGGLRLWTSVGRLRESLEATGQRSAGDGELLLPPTLQLGPPSRGAGRWTLRALKLLGVDVADMAADRLVQKLESQLEPAPGLYRCRTPLQFGAPVKSPADLPARTPLLLFLHGTASSTSGSFGGLAAPERLPVWEKLAAHYGDNVLALEHRTLSRSPIENALDVARLLPERGAVLHLVSHSRGGLVGELLCRGQAADGGDPFRPEALARFARDGRRARDLEALRELRELLMAKRPRVERFVRVACPARGTTLASRRLDLYLSVILNLIGLIPGLRANPVYEFTSALLLAVAKKRTDPEEIPGVEAMMPGSPLVAVLNDPAFRTDADLSVIAGDTQGSGILGRLKALATDLYYLENHDLVVQTGSMVGGGARTRDARFFFAKGSDVDHFQYFRNAESAGRLLHALTGPPGVGGGFEPITAGTAKELKTRAPEALPGTRPVVFVLPGIMGSHLGVGGNRVWIDLLDLARGRFGELDVDAPGVAPDGLVERAYGRLTAFLAASHEVVEFPFDWRRSVVESADRLAEAVAAKLGETPHPVRILAHSMGGLVARAMIARRPDLWRRIVERDGGRLVMLGTPNRGSYVIPRVLVGQERVLRFLAMLDLAGSQAELLARVARFPGILEMLPADGDDDYFGETVWRAMHDAWGGDWVPPAAEALGAARGLRALLDGAEADGRHMAYVAGRAPATPVACQVDMSRAGRGRIRFLATSQGDGRVPWSTGRLDGVRTWYMDAPHGEMADHRPAFPAILELLQRGSTTLLPDQPPAQARGPEAVFVLPDEEPPLFPGEAELAAAALGFDPDAAARETEAEPLTVSVVHGNLSFARYPVAVGHYLGDTLAGAEKVLDAHLGGRLSEKRQLGLYPGPVESSLVVLREDARPAGAVIVGLGDVGSLTPGALERSFTRAMLDYAAQVAEDAERRGAGSGPQSAGVTALLIGSGRGGIAVEDSVRALVIGALNAREALRASPLHGRVRVDRLEFCELYEDLAISATRIVNYLATGTRLAGLIRTEGRLEDRPGGRRRVAFDEPQDWWDRLQVVTGEGGGLVFQSLTERARTEIRLVARQRELVDRFLVDATSQVADDPTLATTLFDLLVPNELKVYARDRNHTVMLLDEGSARYPWELLRDSAPGAVEPLAVTRGVVRQLATARFRRVVATPVSANALVVGDPVTAGFPPLPGAAREAEGVAAALQRSDFSVTTLVRSDFRSIVPALFARPYRVLHLAAHGVHDHATAEGRRVSGMVLGDGVFLQPGEIEQMRYVPELVFLNCCHLGRVDPGQAAAAAATDFPRLAANLATQLIEMGVRAVVAAGWAVQDDAAVTFADTFYERMLAGRPFGVAAHEARQETFRRHPAYNTWGAYQCYGDHGYVLRAPGGTPYAGPARHDFTCAAELAVELANLAQDADTTTLRGVEETRRRLADLEAWIQGGAVPAGWLSQAAVRSALARAYAQVLDFDRAIEHYAALLDGARADYTVESLEQLANLRTRRALERWTRAGTAAERDALRREVEQAVRDLQALPVGAAASAERAALLGDAYKRLARMSARRGRVAPLRRAARAYRDALRAAQGGDGSGPAAPYPLHNWLAVEAVLRHLGAGGEVEELDGWLARGEEAALAEEAGDPGFWSAVALAEGKLVRHLHTGELEAHTGEVIAGYRAAWSRGGSPLHLRSITDQLEWLIDALADPAPSAAGGAAARRRAGLAQALRSIHAAVSTFPDAPTGEGGM